MKKNHVLPEELGYRWKGKPVLLPYLLVARRMFGMTVVTVGVLFYLRFTWFLPTQILIVFYGICLFGAVAKWIRTSYYITEGSLVVRIGKTNHCLEFGDLKEEELRVLSNPLEAVFGCRTVQYGIQYGYHSSKGSHSNLWRDTARFWCIREYQEVRRYCQQALRKSPQNH